jgi:hypothetical protein
MLDWTDSDEEKPSTENILNIQDLKIFNMDTNRSIDISRTSQRIDIKEKVNEK